jgi:hypothetical protein
MLGRFLLRLILVPLGGVIAATVALAIIVIAQRHTVLAILAADPRTQQDYVFALMEGGPLLLTLLSTWAYHMFVLAAAGVLIAEAFAIRSWIFHAANGGLSAWLGWTLTEDIGDEYRLLSDPKILLAAGLAAGLAYWLVAGWTAGFWKPRGAPREPARQFS